MFDDFFARENGVSKTDSLERVGFFVTSGAGKSGMLLRMLRDSEFLKKNLDQKAEDGANGENR